MADDRSVYKRMSAVQRKISDISEKDIRVSVLGRIISMSGGVIALDDGSSTAEIITDAEPAVAVNDFARVFCRVLPLESGYELRAEIVQNMNSLDMETYRKIFG